MDRYEEALERAKAGKPIDEVFPELKKSEDERIRKFLVKHVSEWIGCIEHDLKISSKDVESEEELAMFKAGLAYLERKKEQKPAEWSEEDEESIVDTKCDLYSYFDEGRAEELYNWLKSLRPQSIQDKFDEAMHVADKFEEGYKAGVYDTKAKSWKPSKEQIDAIHEANYRCRAYQFATRLTEIEIQLEKLMNE